MMVPWDAPIFMLPLAGMMFMTGAILHQFAGVVVADKAEFGLWAALSVFGLALQVGAFVILISA